MTKIIIIGIVLILLSSIGYADEYWSEIGFEYDQCNYYDSDDFFHHSIEHFAINTTEYIIFSPYIKNSTVLYYSFPTNSLLYVQYHPYMNWYEYNVYWNVITNIKEHKLFIKRYSDVPLINNQEEINTFWLENYDQNCCAWYSCRNKYNFGKVTYHEKAIGGTHWY